MPVGMTIIKRMPYHGDPHEEWSNHYHLTGDVPTSTSEWDTLFNALCSAEKTVYTSWVEICAGYGYDSDSPTAHAVWTKDLTISPNVTIPGTLASGSSLPSPGDAAVWLRWGLDRLNSKGKRVYLRKYYHGARYLDGSHPDTVDSGQLAALNTLGTILGSTMLSGRLIRDTAGAAVIGHAASSYITTRTLKRRGKRPT